MTQFGPNFSRLADGLTCDRRILLSGQEREIRQCTFIYSDLKHRIRFGMQWRGFGGKQGESWGKAPGQREAEDGSRRGGERPGKRGAGTGG